MLTLGFSENISQTISHKFDGKISSLAGFSMIDTYLCFPKEAVFMLYYANSTIVLVHHEAVAMAMSQ